VTNLLVTLRIQNLTYLNSIVRHKVRVAEASIAVYGAVVGVFITLTLVCFALRGKGHHDKIPFTPVGQ
jgi:hypothetical protein